MVRNILHLRVENFPVAVERLRDAFLRDRPVVICSRHSPRSLIFSASKEARKEGVFEGLPLTKALRRCRGLIVLPPDQRLYQEAEKKISHMLERYSPLVEPNHQGCFYADMTGTARLFGEIQDSASRIRHGIQDSIGLGSTLGIGSNKLVSGVAARVVESHGDLCAVPSGSEASFLAPLRVEMLPSVRNRKDRALLQEFNIHMIRELAALSILQLTSVFGKRGLLLHTQAVGIDERPVRPPSSKPFVLEERTLDEDTNDDSILLGILYGMTERACHRMRIKNVLPRTVWLHLRYTDGMDVSRCFRLQVPIVTDPLLFQKLEPLYLKTNFRRQRVRYLSLTFTDLGVPPAQMTLFKDPRKQENKEALVSALDKIRMRYGQNAILFGRTLRRRD